MAWVAQARVAAHRADLPAAGQALARAQRLRSLLTYAVPPIAVQARIELIHAYLALADVAGARTLMREIDELLERRPQLGVLVVQVQELRGQLATRGGSGDTGASTLTAAELRLLPLLATHLTLAEIAAELYVSRNTVKSQTQAVFSKLGATRRSEAVARSRELGLLEG
jgi:LuxR family maltose regulon positive regulatory protein